MEKKFSESLEKQLNLSQDQIDVVIFGYRLFVYTIIGYLMIVVVAYGIGTLSATLTAALTTSAFRIFSGGAHASSQNRCVLMGTIIFNVIGWMAYRTVHLMTPPFLKGLIAFTFLLALVTFLLKAPADTPGKPITAVPQRNKLKMLSILLLFFWGALIFYVQRGFVVGTPSLVAASCLGLIWQSVSLWPIAYRLTI